MSPTKYSVDELGGRIDAFLQKVYRLAGFDLQHEVTDGSDTHVNFENPDVMVRFTGPDVDLLLANKAELLLALEHLAMESLRMPGEHHSMLCFDANDHRVMRIEELRLSALTAAEKVRKSRVPFRFSPMNSRERRIVHLALRDEKDLRSESLGAGPHRQVVVYPADMPSLPEPPRVPETRPYGRGGGGGGGGGRGGSRETRGGRDRRRPA